MASVCSQVPRNWKIWTRTSQSGERKNHRREGADKAINQPSCSEPGHGCEMWRSRLMRWTSLHGSLGGSLRIIPWRWPVDEGESVAQDYDLMLCLHAHVISDEERYIHMDIRHEQTLSSNMKIWTQTWARSKDLVQKHEVLDSRSSQLQAWKARSTIWI